MIPPDAPTDPIDTSSAVSLVREGWRQLALQRPLAAWAVWQRALRCEPDDPAATQAIETLRGASELPVSARAVYRFRAPPADSALRERWDARLKAGGGLDGPGRRRRRLRRPHEREPERRRRLAEPRPLPRLARQERRGDHLPRPRRLAPRRRRPEPECRRLVLRRSPPPRRRRRGPADDCRYAWVVDPLNPQTTPDSVARLWPDLYPVETPSDPITGAPELPEARVFEWLDRPPLPAGSVPEDASRLPRVLASVIVTPRLLRASSPDPSGFALFDEPRYAALAPLLSRARRERAPLPIAWADSALGTFHLPSGLDDAEKASLTRSVVEHYFVNLWLHQPRHALGGLSPLQASRGAARGDVVARAKLSAVVNYREQLGARATHLAVYQGYPFDRLRLRLGLVSADDSLAVDADDLTCLGERELDALDPGTLDGHRLADAFASAAGLRDDARTARFATALVTRGFPTSNGPDPATVFAPLVRESLRLGRPDEALNWLSAAPKSGDGQISREFNVWAAEILARSGRPDEALSAYQTLLSRFECDAGLALDGAETLIDNGHAEQALVLLREAKAVAGRSGDVPTLRRAEALIGRHESTP